MVKTDVSAFGPSVQFRYQRELEPPIRSKAFRGSTSCRSSGISTTNSTAVRADRLVRRRDQRSPGARRSAAALGGRRLAADRAGMATATSRRFLSCASPPDLASTSTFTTARTAAVAAGLLEPEAFARPRRRRHSEVPVPIRRRVSTSAVDHTIPVMRGALDSATVTKTISSRANLSRGGRSTQRHCVSNNRRDRGAAGVWVGATQPDADPPIRSDGYNYYLYAASWVVYHDVTLEAVPNDWNGGAYPDFAEWFAGRRPTTG